MSRLNRILLIALPVQVGLFLITWFATGSSSTTQHDLISGMAADDVTGIEVSDKGGTVRLAKTGGNWVVSSESEYPADPGKIDPVLEAVFKKVGTPIATKASHHKDLGVDADSALRKVVLSAGEETRTVFMAAGTRAGAHVRVDGNNDVYRVSNLKAHQIGVAGTAYFNRRYIDVESDSVRYVEVVNSEGRLAFERAGAEDPWAPAGLEIPGGTAVDSLKVSAFVHALAHVQMSAPAGTIDQPAFGFEAPTAVVTLKDDTGKEYRYVVGVNETEASAYVKSSDSRFVVAVGAFSVKQAREKKLADLLGAPPAPPPIPAP